MKITPINNKPGPLNGEVVTLVWEVVNGVDEDVDEKFWVCIVVFVDFTIKLSKELLIKILFEPVPRLS